MTKSSARPDWLDNPPASPALKLKILRENQRFLKSPGPKGRALRTMLRETQNYIKLANEEAQKIQPLAYFKPSLDQALILNSWMYGIAFNCIYSANRIGKTTACIINIILWIFPLPLNLRIFQPYRVGDPLLDPENQDSPQRGQLVQVFPRPDISALRLIKRALAKLPHHIPPPNPRLPHYHPDNLPALQWLQKQVPQAYRPAFPDAAWSTGGNIWFGAPNQDTHEQTLLPLWKQYLPSPSIQRFVLSEREISLSIRNPTTARITAWELVGKSYESKDTTWASGAVDIIMLTEGITPSILKEVKLRFRDPGIGSHDFTPYLPANSGPASALAQRIDKGKEPLPLPHFVFKEFTVYDTPIHVIPPDKKEGLIRSYKDDPEGEARLLGKFYSSSMLILSNLSRDIHLLPWSKSELFERFPDAQLYRGLDPGLDHPTACCWAALLRSNVFVIYRYFSQQRLSISERAKRIVTLSGNSLHKVKWGPGKEDFYLQEVHTSPNSEIFLNTFADFHIFKEDETTGLPFSLNYNIAGLQISESTHMRPEDRAQKFDDLLHPSPFVPHILTGVPPGPKVYFLINEPGVAAAVNIWEELYWERLRSGPDKGLPKDTVPSHGDDELDAGCYVVCAPIRWTSYRPPARIPNDSEAELTLIEASQAFRRRSKSQQHFATAAKSDAGPAAKKGFATIAKQSREVVFFGDPNADEADNDDPS